MSGLRWLLIFVPIAILAKALQWSELIIFATSALAVVPLAGLLGEATEALAEQTGPRIGGLLNATLGNAAELIITLFAIRAGLLDLVRASIIGSILGNVLLVAGFSILVGGLKNGIQKFDRSHVGLDATMTILAVIALSVPSIFNAAIEPDKTRVEELSLTVAAAMLLIYGLSILFAFRSRNHAAPDVRRRSHDRRLLSAGVHLAHAELVGVGMSRDLENARRDDVSERRRQRGARFDFQPRHGEQVRELVRRKRRVDQAAQPALGYVHGRVRRTA